MSVNNVNSIETQTNEIYAKYTFSDSSYESTGNANSPLGSLPSKYNITTDSTYSDIYSIPIDSVKNFINTAEAKIYQAKDKLEKNLLRKIFIDPYCDPDLEQAHFYLWTEACRYLNIPDKSEIIKITNPIEDGTIDQIIEVDPRESDGTFQEQPISTNAQKYLKLIKDQSKNSTIAKDNPPQYISFDQYLFAESYQSTASRRLVQEYHEAISHSTFSYLFQLRKILDLFLNEIYFIRRSLTKNYGDAYENEPQQKIAIQYDAWGKMALHYTVRVDETIKTLYSGIPNAEVDQITKAQAAKLQAFFAIRVNAADSEINDLLSSLERDIKDNGDIFYEQYLDNSLRISTEISESLEFDFLTTSFASENPSLAKEVIVATNFVKGNYASILADYIERYSNVMMKTDAIFQLIAEKRKYCRFINQLSHKSIKSKKILKVVETDNYAPLFGSIRLNQSRNDTFISSHSDLDDLEKDAHPQYLLKNGGRILGNIQVEDGITIDGVDISSHRHTGSDGSARINALDIDYDSLKNENKQTGIYADKPLSVSIAGFIPDIINGGIPVFDTIIAIETDDNLSDHEYEITYTEID